MCFVESEHTEESHTTLLNKTDIVILSCKDCYVVESVINRIWLPYSHIVYIIYPFTRIAELKLSMYSEMIHYNRLTLQP